MHLPDNIDELVVSVRGANVAIDGAAEARDLSFDSGPSGDQQESGGASSDATDEDLVGRFEVSNDGAVTTITETADDGTHGTLRIGLPLPHPRVRVRARSGASELEAVSGKLDVRSSNGAVVLRGCSGDARLMCANGSISADGCELARLDASTSNGKIGVTETVLAGGTIKTANGRIRLQVRRPPPGSDVGAGKATERLTIYSANGGVSLALPEETAALFKVQTLGRVRNDLPVTSVQTNAGITSFRTGDESNENPFVILIKNLRGGVDLMRYGEFTNKQEPERDEDEFFGEDAHTHGVWFDVDFSEELPKFMHEMKRFGSKFGNLGEEISREMGHAFKFGGPQKWRARAERHSAPDHDPQHADELHRAQAPADTSDEVKLVLDMLKEGRISVEEAETLIAAIRRT